ncbi:hypothetical protein D3C86_1324480 [compost metagenome]
MSISMNIISKINLYRPNGEVEVAPVKEYWTIADISYHYPLCSKTGFDQLLFLVPEEERDGTTIVFYDGNGNVTFDPRIYMEDL